MTSSWGPWASFRRRWGLSCEDCHSGSDTVVGGLRPGHQPEKSDGAPDGADDGVHQPGELRGAAGRDVLHLPSRRQLGPRVTPSLAALYTRHRRSEEQDDIVVPATGPPSAVQIRQIHSGARRGAAAGRADELTSQGHQRGVTAGGDAAARDLRQGAGQRATIIHTLDGDNTTAYDGRAGWIAAPHRPVAVLGLTGGELDGVRLDAELAFPARIKETLGQWRAGVPTEIDDKAVQVVQGSRPNGALATFYFDSETGLLTRLVRYANSQGRPPADADRLLGLSRRLRRQDAVQDESDVAGRSRRASSSPTCS